MYRYMLTLIASVCLLYFNGCAPKQLVIPGTGDSQDILRHLAADYHKAHPQTAIVIPDSTGSFSTKPGTLGGLESAGTQTTALGRTAIRPREEDLRKYGPMYYREFARVPVAFVVHQDLPVRAITNEQLCAIYAGRITDWSELGGPALPIVVQTRPEGSNMLAMRKSIPCFKALKVTESGHFNLRNANAVESLRSMAGSIGFMPLSEARQHGFQTLTLNGKEPSADDYPVTISLGLVHKLPLKGLAKDFDAYLNTETAAHILRQTGHIPIQATSELVAW